MLLETSTKLCIKALNDFYKLKDDEKLELVAIILEHWSKEQIFNNDKEVFLPYDVDFYNITSFSALCFLSAKILRKVIFKKRVQLFFLQALVFLKGLVVWK